MKNNRKLSSWICSKGITRKKSVYVNYFVADSEKDEDASSLEQDNSRVDPQEDLSGSGSGLACFRKKKKKSCKCCCTQVT